MADPEEDGLKPEHLENIGVDGEIQMADPEEDGLKLLRTKKPPDEHVNSNG